jgi:hypothetical protein
MGFKLVLKNENLQISQIVIPTNSDTRHENLITKFSLEWKLGKVWENPWTENLIGYEKKPTTIFN